MAKRKSTTGQTTIYKTKDRVIRTSLKTGGELRCSGRVGSSCSTSGTRRVNLVTNPVISREWGKDREVFTTSGTYPWSFVTQIFHNDQPSHGGDRQIFEVMTVTLPKVYSRKKSCTLNQISIFELIMHMFLATLYQNYVKKMNSKKPHCRNNSKIQ